MELVHKTQKGTPVTTSLKVAEVFEKDHKNVIASIKSIMRSAENSAHFYHSTTYKDSSNRNHEMFLMNEEGFSLLAMGFTGEKALQWKIKYIQAFKKMRETITDYMAMIPKTYADALEAFAKSVRENEEKDRKLALQAPKVDFADRVIDNDLMTDIGQAAKLLQLSFGRNTLFEELRKSGIFFKNRNEPKQEYVDRGYFVLKQKMIERNEHPAFVVTKVLVTQKGLFWLSKMFDGKYTPSIPSLNLQ